MPKIIAMRSATNDPFSTARLRRYRSPSPMALRVIPSVPVTSMARIAATNTMQTAKLSMSIT